MKPNLTPEQKLWFENEFIKLIYQSSKEVQDLWESDPHIGWSISNEPVIPNGIENKLIGILADSYTIIWNKLNDRRI